MAGKKIQDEIFCWSLKRGRLTVHLASTRKGAIKTKARLDEKHDCVMYFNGIFPGRMIIPDKEMNSDLIMALKGALDNKKINKELPLDISGTDFQMKIWKLVARIPFGETRTYGEVALMSGRPFGARAVGQVMRRNPLPVIFPCHRVVAAGGIGGFTGGLELKRYLLEREKI